MSTSSVVLSLSDSSASHDAVYPLSASSSRQQQRLYPKHPSDLVIHYRHTDFHVHAFVLCHDSTYFRTYLDTQTPLKVVKTEEVEDERGTKRRKVTAFTSSDVCAKCGPFTLTQCIELDDHCGPRMTDVTEADFLLFLQHLYHSAILHSPPMTPKRSILDSITDDTPISLTAARPVNKSAVRSSIAELKAYGGAHQRWPLHQPL